MSSLLWNALTASPVIFGASLLFVNSASASQTPITETVTRQTAITITEKLTASVEPADQDNILRSQMLIEKSSFSPLTSLEIDSTSSGESAIPTASHSSETVAKESNLSQLASPTINPTLELADSTLAQAMPAPEVVPAESTNTLEQTNHYSNDSTADDPMGQVTNVSQLSDVSPGDWAYEALRSLVERYGCIAGYPDGTFRGNRATTRYEFAAGLNACLQQVERLIAASTENFVTREDLETLQRLVQEFETELATLGTQVDTLEGRVAFIEDHQFSTTTQLSGEVDIGIIDAFGDTVAVPSGQTPTEDLDVNTILAGRAILNFDTSFTGLDRLRTKLEGGNFSALSTGTDMTLYDFDTFTRTGSDVVTTVDTGNDIVLGSLVYQFPISRIAQIFISAQGLGSDAIAPQLNPAGGNVSRFGQRNPIYRLSDGAGIGANLQFSKALGVSFSYLGNTAFFSNPDDDRGLFNGQFGALAQLTFTPSDRFGMAFTYNRYYSPQPGEGINVTGNTGSGFAQTPFGDDAATSANAYGIEAQYRFSPRLAIGGWVGFTDAQAQSDGAIANEGDEAEIWNYAVTLGFPDLGGEGNLLGIIFGMPPRIRGNDVANRRDFDTSYHIEAFYRYRLTDNIAITPGAFVILNPEHNDANDTIFVGTFRTTFTF
ncbi:carbohydrate porin [Microcoleus sp. FACHB-SPT15]|uniref:iron uptake porin n=1 Tax=Microcoleus sp. FACHB-SPT15 TaxID=2692830 RepID=UPI001782DE7D|nr:iron uptake porin [Microcoleus sp. FACHB-SPT15]MBD1807418.1 carbohydrate porin [Microcoleus sp. FACHB-SPT15]